MKETRFHIVEGAKQVLTCNELHLLDQAKSKYPKDDKANKDGGVLLMEYDRHRQKMRSLHPLDSISTTV